MATKRPGPRVVRKSNYSESEAALNQRTAADIRRSQVAGQPDMQPGGIGFNGNFVQTPNGPVWVPHGSAAPADAVPMLARARRRVSDLGQPQTNPNTNLYQYREAGRADPTVTPPMPTEFDFPGTWDPYPQPTPNIPGYNPAPPTTTQPGGQMPPPGGLGTTGPQTPTTTPTNGTLPTPPPLGGGVGPGLPGVGPHVPPQLGLPQSPPQYPGNPLAAFGYTRGPNGEIVPMMLQQGMNPFQMGPSSQQIPGYQFPGFPGG